MATRPHDPSDGWPSARVFAVSAVDEETRAFNADLAERLAAMPKPFDLPVADVRRARADGRGIFPLAGPREGSRWETAEGQSGQGVALRISEPEKGTPHGTYLHFHGGGWTLNAPEQYDVHNQRMARAAGCRVVSVRYRLAPENRWPAQAEDVRAAALWVLEKHGGPLVLGGESAGAHLAVVALLGLREAGLLERVRGAVLNYGMYDLAGTPSLRRWGAEYLVLSTPVVEWFVANLMGDGALDDPAVSPLRADLTGLPPALFQVGTADPLLDDTLFMAARWRAAGAGATLAVAPGGVHAFDQFDLQIAREAQRRQEAFVATCLA